MRGRAELTGALPPDIGLGEDDDPEQERPRGQTRRRFADDEDEDDDEEEEGKVGQRRGRVHRRRRSRVADEDEETEDEDGAGRRGLIGVKRRNGRWSGEVYITTDKRVVVRQMLGMDPTGTTRALSGPVRNDPEEAARDYDK